MSRQVHHWPDPLTFSDGRPVRTTEEWLGPRRAELRSAFERFIYGRAPEAPNVRTSLLSTCGREEQWRLHIDSPSPFSFEILIAVPSVERPVPAIVALNFGGNHAVTPLPSVEIDEEIQGGERGKEADDWSVDETVRRGFALVTAHYQSIEPDKPAATSGIRSAFGGKCEWGAIAAWAWGLSRILDAIQLDPRIDASRVGVTGHSRLGKAALLAAAFDDRFAFCAPVQSGCGGAAPSRGTVGESVAQITKVFPHWFTSAFADFAGRTQDLPVDQHELMAMVAPRPLLIANAEDDLWANPAGQIEALAEAERVYELLGRDVTGTYIRPGGHRMSRTDWNAVRDFAAAVLAPSK